MEIDISYDHIVMHKLEWYLGMNCQVNEYKVMELNRMLLHSTRK
jgi:hypothetical protein